MKKYILFFAISLCLGSCAFWDSISGVIHVPQYAVATIIVAHIPQHSGASSLCEYSVNGVKHRANGPYPSHYIVKGEKYMIKYDSLHPTFSEILDEQPIFLPEENVVNSIGIVSAFSKVACMFVYLDKQKNLMEDLQSVPKGTLEKYPQLKVGATFEVKFDPDNPQRAIIYLDKPASDTLQEQLIYDKLGQQKRIKMSKK